MNSKKDILKMFEEGTEIDRALVRGVRQALRVHKALGHPVVEWKDGRVVWTQPEDLEIPDGDDPIPRP